MYYRPTLYPFFYRGDILRITQTLLIRLNTGLLLSCTAAQVADPATEGRSTWEPGALKKQSPNWGNERHLCSMTPPSEGVCNIRGLRSVVQRETFRPTLSLVTLQLISLLNLKVGESSFELD